MTKILTTRAAVFGVLGVACTMTAPATAQSVTWDLTNDYAASSLPGQVDQFFADRLAELSGGDIDLTLHLGGALGYSSQDAFDAVRTGAVDLADASTAFWGGIEPIFRLSSLPFLLASADESRLLYEAAREHYEAVLVENNQTLLYAVPWPPSGIWANAPLGSLDDLSGLEIRSYDATSTTTLDALGAAPVQLPWGDVVPQLAANAISAVLTSADGGISAQFWEHLDHFVEINYAMPLSMTTLNLDAYESLTPEQQEIVRTAAAEAEAFAWEALATRTAENYEILAERGVTVVDDLPDTFVDEMIAAGAATHEQWAADVGEVGESILSDFRDAAGR